MATPEMALNPLNGKPAKMDAQARARMKTKHLNPLTPLNALKAFDGKEFKEFKASYSLEAKQLLERLTFAGVTIWRDGDAMRWRGAADVLTETDRAELRRLKPELLLLLANGLSTPPSDATPDTAPPSDVQRIRELAAQVTPAEFCRARRGIAPALRRNSTSAEINELILEVCLLARERKQNVDQVK